jgi:hypothetical protein
MGMRIENHSQGMDQSLSSVRNWQQNQTANINSNSFQSLVGQIGLAPTSSTTSGSTSGNEVTKVAPAGKDLEQAIQNLLAAGKTQNQNAASTDTSLTGNLLNLFA